MLADSTGDKDLPTLTDDELALRLVEIVLGNLEVELDRSLVSKCQQ